jgi:hypothetical protein
MSKIFSCVEASDGFHAWGFTAPGWVQDEDDFLCTDRGSEIAELMMSDLDVDVRIYCYGEGESESATEEDVEELTEDFINNECDCIRGVGFTIYMEDEDND